MWEFSLSFIGILLVVVAFLLALVLWALLRISRGLARVENLLARIPAGDSTAGPEPSRDPAVEQPAAGGVFETFLSEDPERRKMPRKEQFAAYRNWRRAKGLNWSARGDS